MSAEQFFVELGTSERERRYALISKGKTPVKVILKARILLKADTADGAPARLDDQIVKVLEATSTNATARRTCSCYLCRARPVALGVIRVVWRTDRPPSRHRYSKCIAQRTHQWLQSPGRSIATVKSSHTGWGGMNVPGENRLPELRELGQRQASADGKSDIVSQLFSVIDWALLVRSLSELATCGTDLVAQPKDGGVVVVAAVPLDFPLEGRRCKR